MGIFKELSCIIWPISKKLSYQYYFTNYFKDFFLNEEYKTINKALNLFHFFLIYG